MTSSVSGEEARKLWRDAPADDWVLDVYLNAAYAACIAYAPEYVADKDSPTEPTSGERTARFVLAQVMQARNIYNSGRASAATGDYDGSGYGISSFPLDWQVKQLLRPMRGLGAIA